jgi:hypothetical protein
MMLCRGHGGEDVPVQAKAQEKKPARHKGRGGRTGKMKKAEEHSPNNPAGGGSESSRSMYTQSGGETSFFMLFLEKPLVLFTGVTPGKVSIERPTVTFAKSSRRECSFQEPAAW